MKAGRTRPRRLAASAFAAVSLLALAACETVPATGREAFVPLSLSEEGALGQQEHPKILATYGGAYDDPELQRYVESLGQLLAQTSELPDQTWTFTVLNSDTVNAFALPGGYIYVTRGLIALAEDEAELAGVIGHEIGHVTARHAAQRYGQSILTGVGAVAAGILLGGQAANIASGIGQMHVASYSREQENEADSLGIRYMARAGHDPAAMSSFLRKLEAQKQLLARILNQTGGGETSYLSTHPPTMERVQKTAAEGSETPVIDPMRARDVFLDRIDGMIYGDDPAQGLVKGRVFAHPTLGFRFQVPPDFSIVNGTQRVTAIGPRGARILFDQEPSPTSVAMTAYVARLFQGRAPSRNIEAIDINGMEAATGYARAATDAGPMDVRAVAVRWGPKTIYRFLFVTPPSLTQGLATELQRTTYSFRRLRHDEVEQLRPYRIRIEAVRSGDTVESLAARLPFEDYRLERFLVLNDVQVGDRLEPGQRIKMIVE